MAALSALVPEALGAADGAAMPHPTLWETLGADVASGLLVATGPLGGGLGGVIGEGARDVCGVAHAWVLPVQKFGVLAALAASLALGILELSWRLEVVDLDGRDAAHGQCEDCALHCWR